MGDSSRADENRYDLARNRARGPRTLTRQRPAADVQAIIDLASIPVVERALPGGTRATIGDIAGRRSILLNRKAKVFLRERAALDGGRGARLTRDMAVFDHPRRRIDIDPRGDGEPLFSFLDRSARPRARVMRERLEDWFAHFPVAGQADLRGRLRSVDNRQHLGGFFELYLFTLFSALGFRLELHPSLASTTRTPDFRVSRGAIDFYLEATLAAPSDAETAATKRANRVYETINRLDSPNFFVGVEVTGQPSSDPPGARIRRILANWLSTLDPDEAAADFDRTGLDAAPRMRFEHEGWEIVFSAMPKSLASRGKPGVRPIGFKMFGLTTVETRTAIVHALEDKARRYGALDRPYVIALDVVEAPNYDEDELMDALFGQDTLLRRRLPNGVWVGPKGPRNRNVSGVLAIHDVYADVTQRTPAVWHHPWTRKPLPAGAWSFEHRIPDMQTGRYQVRRTRKRIDEVLSRGKLGVRSSHGSSLRA